MEDQHFKLQSRTIFYEIEMNSYVKFTHVIFFFFTTKKRKRKIEIPKNYYYLNILFWLTTFYF